MRLITLDNRHHGFGKWVCALEFSKKEIHPKHNNHRPYLKAFKDIYGPDKEFKNDGNLKKGFWDSYEYNTNWYFDGKRRRIYFKNPSIMSFVQLKVT